MWIWFANMDLFWHQKHDQRLHVYVVEGIAKSAYYYIRPKKMWNLGSSFPGKFLFLEWNSALPLKKCIRNRGKLGLFPRKSTFFQPWTCPGLHSQTYKGILSERELDQKSEAKPSLLNTLPPLIRGHVQGFSNLRAFKNPHLTLWT